MNNDLERFDEVSVTEKYEEPTLCPYVSEDLITPIGSLTSTFGVFDNAQEQLSFQSNNEGVQGLQTVQGKNLNAITTGTSGYSMEISSPENSDQKTSVAKRLSFQSDDGSVQGLKQAQSQNLNAITSGTSGNSVEISSQENSDQGTSAQETPVAKQLSFQSDNEGVKGLQPVQGPNLNAITTGTSGNSVKISSKENSDEGTSVTKQLSFQSDNEGVQGLQPVQGLNLYAITTGTSGNSVEISSQENSDQGTCAQETPVAKQLSFQSDNEGVQGLQPVQGLNLNVITTGTSGYSMEISSPENSDQKTSVPKRLSFQSDDGSVQGLKQAQSQNLNAITSGTSGNSVEISSQENSDQGTSAQETPVAKQLSFQSDNEGVKGLQPVQGLNLNVITTGTSGNSVKISSKEYSDQDNKRNLKTLGSTIPKESVVSISSDNSDKKPETSTGRGHKRLANDIKRILPSSHSDGCGKVDPHCDDYSCAGKSPPAREKRGEKRRHVTPANKGDRRKSEDGATPSQRRSLSGTPKSHSMSDKATQTIPSLGRSNTGLTLMRESVVFGSCNGKTVQFEVDLLSENELKSLVKYETRWGTIGVGEPVFARWKDKKYYSGVITQKGLNDTWHIAFEDDMNAVASEKHIIPVRIMGIGVVAVYSPDAVYAPYVSKILGHKFTSAAKEGIVEEAQSLTYAIQCTGMEKPIWCTRRQLSIEEKDAKQLRKEYAPSAVMSKPGDISFDNIVGGTRLRLSSVAAIQKFVGDEFDVSSSAEEETVVGMSNATPLRKIPTPSQALLQASKSETPFTLTAAKLSAAEASTSSVISQEVPLQDSITKELTAAKLSAAEASTSSVISQEVPLQDSIASEFTAAKLSAAEASTSSVISQEVPLQDSIASELQMTSNSSVDTDNKSPRKKVCKARSPTKADQSIAKTTAISQDSASSNPLESNSTSRRSYDTRIRCIILFLREQGLG